MDRQTILACTDTANIESKAERANVSIIIPAFHVEKYLPQCLDSVLPAMSARDELILAMGCTDTTGYEVARRYAAQYTCVRVIFQNGTGLSNARNCAFDSASGDYVLFVDGDDFVHGDALSDLLCRLREGTYAADVIMTDFFIFHEETGQCRLAKQVGSCTLNGIERLPDVVKKRRSFWNVWRYLFRKSFLMQNQLRFQENTHGEDVDFLARVFLCEPSILFSNIPFYYYRAGRVGSLMNSCSLRRVEETERILRNTACLLRRSDRPWVSALLECVQWEYIFNFALIEELPTRMRPDGIRMFQSYDQALCPPQTAALKIVVAGIRLLGVHVFSRLMFLMKRLKRKAEGRNVKHGVKWSNA